MCGECRKKLDRYDSLKYHSDTNHNGKPPFEKGQTSLNFGSPTLKRSASQNETLSSPSASEEPLHSDSTPIETTEFHSPPGSSLFRPGPGTTTGVSSPPASDTEDNAKLIGKMKTLLGQFELNICSSRSATLVSPTTPHSSKTQPKAQAEALVKQPVVDKFTTQLNLLQNCYGLKHTENLLDDVFELNLEQTEILCLFCYDNDKTAKHEHGNFNVDGVEYEKGPVRSKKFRNLIKLLRKHIKLESHQKKANMGAMAMQKRWREIVKWAVDFAR